MHLIDEMNIGNSVFNLDGDCSNYMRTQKHRSQEEFSRNLFLVTIPIVAEAFRRHVGMRVGSASLDAKFMNGVLGNALDDPVAVRDRGRVTGPDETPPVRDVHQRAAAGGNSRVGGEGKVGVVGVCERQQSFDSAVV